MITFSQEQPTEFPTGFPTRIGGGCYFNGKRYEVGATSTDNGCYGLLCSGENHIVTWNGDFRNCVMTTVMSTATV